MKLKLVQTQLPEAEYQLLRKLAEKEGKTLKEVVREALRVHVLADTVNAKDPIFRLFPLGKSGRRGHSTAEDHDVLLYPREG